MLKKSRELKIIYALLALLFCIFLLMPVATLLYKSFVSGNEISLANYTGMFQSGKFMIAFKNSFLVSGVAAFVTLLLAFLLAYTINFTNAFPKLKKSIKVIATMPMLLPTITYGFAIIYTFGKQGLFTKLIHIQFFDIYGFWGLLIAYVIYTLPIAFLLLNNAMRYIDKKFIIVSKIMQDNTWKRFMMTTIIPLIPTLAAAFIQSFFLCFTDFGIPAAVGGEFNVVATTLYNEMLGAIPNFANGAVVAMMMLLPSIASIAILHYLERFNVRYHKVTDIDLPKHKIRDRICSISSLFVLGFIVSIFAVIIILPFISEWPYDASFTLDHFVDTLTSSNLLGVYKNSLLVALGSALFGTVVAYCSALITMRSKLSKFAKTSIDIMSSISNSIPGMVIGIAFLFIFSGTSLQNTFYIIIICNVIHFFCTPYVMAKNTLGKMNASFETTAMLMGDSWWKTIRRVVIPNSKSTILEMFAYYFTNSMVTISALIFIVGAKTAVLTTKIKELQHFAKFDEIFVLSLLILITNLIVKGLVQLYAHKKEGKQVEKKSFSIKKIVLALGAVVLLAFTFIFGTSQEKVVIYSNADEEALVAIRHALDENGFADQYILQSFGTSELGGKLMAEGSNIEADLISMSTYYVDSAQEKQNMFEKLTFRTDTIRTYSDYDTPLTALEGALIVNTQFLEEKGLSIPTSIKELTDDKYKGYISIPDIKASSTGWLLVQAILNTYGEDEGNIILTKLLDNVGPHLESSGSGPIKKVRSGEVGIAFGLRHQAIADSKKGLPIQVVDPTEGNYTLTESLAVVKKENSATAMAIARCIMENARSELLETYPTTLYEGEEVDRDVASTKPRIYKYPLTVDLLKEHQTFFEECQK
ncbi:extracellular solute-binding protein [Amedibacillus sp. YH-ame6]